MGITLVVNPGSTSRKYAFYRGNTKLAAYTVERAGEVYALSTEVGGRQESLAWNDPLEDTLPAAVAWAVAAKVLASAADIDTVALRVVAPGPAFLAHQRIDAAVEKRLRDVAHLVPLHAPIALAELAAARRMCTTAKIVGVSDSAFHHTLRTHTTFQSLGQGMYRKVGYHGLSVASVARRLPMLFGQVPRRVVVVHLGGGVSATALESGVSVATTMGFTPASGLMMGTRAGDIGADAVLAYADTHNLSPRAALEELYTAGGFAGAAPGGDLRLLMEGAARGDVRASETMAAFRYQLRSAIASHILELGGIDALVLTATAFWRNPALRALVVEDLHYFGFALDTVQNERLIGAPGRIEVDGTIPIAVVKTDEMEAMALAASTVA